MKIATNYGFGLSTYHTADGEAFVRKGGAVERVAVAGKLLDQPETLTDEEAKDICFRHEFFVTDEAWEKVKCVFGQ